MQELFNIFERMNYPYFRQGSLTDETYPNSFFTFWNYNTPELKHRDNDCKEYAENVTVCYYTNNPTLIYSVMDQFISIAKEQGIKIESRAYDTPADKDSFFGRLVRIKIIHEEE